MIKEEKYSVEDKLQMPCPACEQAQEHTVQTATKQGKITKAACDTCGTVSTFARGVKTSVSMGGGKAASAYDRKLKYKKGQAMQHDVFGRGEVTAVIEPQKIDVLFGDRTRRMLHDQS